MNVFCDISERAVHGLASAVVKVKVVLLLMMKEGKVRKIKTTVVCSFTIMFSIVC